MTSAGDREQRHIHFTGRVQGVGFRYTVRQIAAGMDIVGYVRNLADGRVELKVEGPPAEIDRLVREITDHFGGYITQTKQDRREATGEFRSFEVRY